MAVVGLFYLLLHSLIPSNGTLLHYAHHCLLLLHLSPPTLTNAPQRDRSIMDLPSIKDDDVNRNDNDKSIIDPAHKPHTPQLGEEAPCIVRRNPCRRSVALQPKIKLTPRRGGRGPLLVSLPGVDVDYDNRPTFLSNFSNAPLPTTLSSSRWETRRSPWPRWTRSSTGSAITAPASVRNPGKDRGRG